MLKNIFIFVTLLSILPSIGGQQSGLRPANFIQYDFPLNWTSAQSYCRKKHIDLVTIRSQEDNERFRGGRGWMGLYRENNQSPWKWSRGDETENYTNWDPDQPEKNEHCAFKNTNSLNWRNDRCHDYHDFMCYDEKLVLVKDNKTWEEALEHCRSLGGGNTEATYDLATLITSDDHEYARERAQHATTEEVWTGLRYLGDQWFWVSGEQMQHKDIPSCPAGRCGVLEKSGNTLFGIRDCSQRSNFFCYKRSSNNHGM